MKKLCLALIGAVLFTAPLDGVVAAPNTSTAPTTFAATSSRPGFGRHLKKKHKKRMRQHSNRWYGR